MLISTIEELKKVVKINATIPFEALEPYLNDALYIYIEPQIGEAIIIVAEGGQDEQLRSRICQSLGPLTLALATDELGVRYGDAGITVDNVQGQRSPANEAKIAAAKKNLFFRGMQALDRLLDYLSKHPDKYPDYQDHLATVGKMPCLVTSAQDYQDVGLVQIDYSTLTYRTLLPTLRQVQECDIRMWLKDPLYNKLLGSSPLTSQERTLKELCIRYLCNRVAELTTSQTAHAERQNRNPVEYEPLIRPLYRDTQENGNFFAEQAAFYASSIAQYIREHAEELGVQLEHATMNWNAKDKKLITSIL